MGAARCRTLNIHVHDVMVRGRHADRTHGHLLTKWRWPRQKGLRNDRRVHEDHASVISRVSKASHRVRISTPACLTCLQGGLFTSRACKKWLFISRKRLAQHWILRRDGTQQFSVVFVYPMYLRCPSPCYMCRRCQGVLTITDTCADLSRVRSGSEQDRRSPGNCASACRARCPTTLPSR